MENALVSKKLAGWACVVLAASYLAVAVGTLMMPEAQREGNIHEMLLSMRETTTGFTILHWSSVVGGLVALAAVPAIAAFGSPMWANWAKSLGMLGFSIWAINSVRLAWVVPWEVSDYARVPEDASLYAIRSDNLHLPVDINGFFGFGIVGVFILVTLLGAKARRTLPEPLVWIGLGGAVCYFLVVAGNVLAEGILITIAAIAGGVVLAPVFFVWIGRILLASHIEEDELLVV